jgi:RES domain
VSSQSSAAVDKPGEHHVPPAAQTFNQLSLPICSLPARQEFLRIHGNQREAIFFGDSGGSRFDAPQKEYKGMYIALNAAGAFRETVLRNVTYKLVDDIDLQKRALSTVWIDRPLTLTDLTGAGLAHIGADSRLTVGSYQVSQAWALAIWNHPDRVDGIYYRSRMDPSQCCIMLFQDRVDLTLIHEAQIVDNLLNYSDLQKILDAYKYLRSS